MEPAKDTLNLQENIPLLEQAGLGDLRFRALMSETDWASLPKAVRARFSSRVATGETKIYAGFIQDVRMSRAGHALVQLARLVGAPFPLSRDTGTASVVTVTEASGGQVWTRLYARRRGLPQVIHSTKLFAGPSGLEEHVGGGIVMRLTVLAEDGKLVFRSCGFALRLGRLRIALPAWLTPGRITVTHEELGRGAFIFRLDVVHPRLGELIHQSAIFHESRP